MTDPILPEGDGHTALTDDDIRGLIPSYISTRGELFDAEQRNIARALLRRSPTVTQLLDVGYLKDLHKAMFGDVWSWAGRYRTRETNLGFDPGQIATAVLNLVDDTKAWVDLETYRPDEIAVRFHHRMVQIHPFPNGNGRHGRIAADYLGSALGRPTFSWGARLDLSTAELRAVYHASLKAADRGDVGDLLVFARS